MVSLKFHLSKGGVHVPVFRKFCEVGDELAIELKNFMIKQMESPDDILDALKPMAVPTSSAIDE